VAVEGQVHGRIRIKVCGVLLTVLAGCCEELRVDSTAHLVDQGTNPFDCVLPLFTGLFITAAAVLLMYVVMHGRKSDLPQGVILPGLLRGVGWALMVLILMFANEMLPLTISYPLSLTVLAVAITGFAFHCGEFPTRRARILAALCTVMLPASLACVRCPQAGCLQTVLLSATCTWNCLRS